MQLIHVNFVLIYTLSVTSCDLFCWGGWLGIGGAPIGFQWTFGLSRRGLLSERGHWNVFKPLIYTFLKGIWLMVSLCVYDSSVNRLNCLSGAFDTSRSNEIDIERNLTGRTRSLCSNYELINDIPFLDITGQIRDVLCEILEKIYRDISGVHCIHRMVFHCLCELSQWLLLLILLYMWVNKRYLN